MMEELVERARALREASLAVPVLVRARKRPREGAADAGRARKLAAQRRAEDRLAQMMAVERDRAARELVRDAEAMDVMDIEERLLTSNSSLKQRLFDSTVDAQQLRLIVDRVLLSAEAARQATAEAKAAQEVKAGPQAGQLAAPPGGTYAQRDQLATEVIKLSKELAELVEEDLQQQREMRAHQGRARRAWQAVSAREPAAAAGRKPPDAKLLEHNAWLRHVLVSMALEAKVNWAEDPTLRGLFLGAA